MHKFKGISLIETLISLTIVGVALVALLPVITIRQSAFSVSTGKEYFTEVPATPFIPAHYRTDDKQVFLGDFATNSAGNRKLTVDTFEFAYKDIPTLNATERLHYNTNRIQVINNGLNISSGTRAEFTMQYPANVFFNNNNVIINNTTDINTRTALKFAPNLNDITSYPKKDYTSSANPTQSLDFIPSLEGSNFYTISIGDNEYFSYNVNNIDGISARQIGIGRNALIDYVPHRDFIGIFNEDNNTKLLYSAIPANFLLAIGRVTAGGTNTWQDYRSFVISYDDIATNFNFNANVVAPNLTTTNVILTSDKRLKTILGEYKKSLKELLKIKPVAFTYKNDDKQDKHIGVIAQDIRKTFPEAVKVGKDNYLLVSIEPMFYALLNSIKELDKKNKNLKEQNDKLEKKINELRKIAGGKHE